MKEKRKMMNIFEKVQEAIRPHAQNGHARRNEENKESLKKANQEIKEMLCKDKYDHMHDDMVTSFKNETADMVNKLLCTAGEYASRYQVDKKEILSVLIEELDMNKIERIDIEIKDLLKDMDNHNSPIREQISKLRAEKRKYIISEKLFETDLYKYEGKDLSSITAIDESGNDVFIPDDEIVCVKDGKLYCSSYDGGILRFDNESNSYMHDYHFSSTRINILGFIDIEIDDWSEDE